MFQAHTFPFPGDYSGGVDTSGMGIQQFPSVSLSDQFSSHGQLGTPQGQVMMNPMIPQDGSMASIAPQQETHGRLQLSRINLNSIEVPFFQQLWAVANPQGTLTLAGQQAAEFLRFSGLPRPTLHQIWNLADLRNEGCLGFEEFCIACRLIAHAQNAIPVTPEMVNEEPFSLPQFDMSQLHSSISEASTIGLTDMGAAAMSGIPSPGLSPTHFMSSDDILGQSTGSYFISENDRQKYLGIFQKLPLDMEGYLTGDDAKSVMSRSGMSEADLYQIWMLADQDGDGRLSSNEFVVAMHLITVCRKGVPIPQALPPELQSVLLNAPLAHAPTESVFGPTEAADAWGAPPLFEGFPPLSKPDKATKGEEVDLFQFPESPGSVSKKKSKKSKKQDEALSFGDLVEQTRREESGSQRSDSNDIQLTSRPRTRLRLDQESETREFEETTSRISKSKDSRQIIKDTILADRQLSKAVAKSVDALADELSHLTDISAALKAELITEKKDLKRQLDRRREFETEVAELKLELEKIQEERRQIDHEKVSVTRDLDHYQNEMLFLKRQLEETERDILMLQDSNVAFEKNLKQTEHQIRQLSIARKTTMGKIEAEKEMLKEQEKEILEMRTTLEKMRREKEDAQSKYALLQEKLRQADQDRGQLLHSVETERLKLTGIQNDRVDASDEKARLARIMVDTDQDWISVNRPSCVRPSESEVVDSYQSVGHGSRLPRDLKGVPSGAASTSLTPVYPHGKTIRGDLRPCDSLKASDFRAQFASMGSSHATAWTSFGQSGAVPSEFQSVGAGHRNERRGIDRISRELTSGGDALSSDFVRSREETGIGGRKSERTDFSVTKRELKKSPQSSGDSDHGEKKSYMRNRKEKESETAPPLKPPKKKKSSKKNPRKEWDTTGGDSVGFGSDANGHKSLNNQGIETPSFGSRSVIRSRLSR